MRGRGVKKGEGGGGLSSLYQISEKHNKSKRLDAFQSIPVWKSVGTFTDILRQRHEPGGRGSPHNTWTQSSDSTEVHFGVKVPHCWSTTR